MRGIFATVAAGIVVLGLVALALTAWATRAPEPGGPPASPEREAPAAAAPVPVAAPPAVGAVPAAAVPSSLPRVELTSAPRRQGLFAFRRELKGGLADLRARVAACEVGDAEFVLDVETVAGALRVADARVEGKPPAPAALACARAALVGARLDAPSAEPGLRWQLPFAATAAAP